MSITVAVLVGLKGSANTATVPVASTAQSSGSSGRDISKLVEATPGLSTTTRSLASSKRIRRPSVAKWVGPAASSGKGRRAPVSRSTKIDPTSGLLTTTEPSGVQFPSPVNQPGPATPSAVAVPPSSDHREIEPSLQLETARTRPAGSTWTPQMLPVLAVAKRSGRVPGRQVEADHLARTESLFLGPDDAVALIEPVVDVRSAPGARLRGQSPGRMPASRRPRGWRRGAWSRRR